MTRRLADLARNRGARAGDRDHALVDGDFELLRVDAGREGNDLDGVIRRADVDLRESRQAVGPDTRRVAAE
jgi:hypothetical protein